jgi:protein O-GlcNAc transferase
MTSAVQWNQLGIENKRQGRWDEAIACYEQALSLQPDFAEAHFNMGILWRDQGRIDQALACFERTLALRPDVVQARFELANLFFQMKDFDAAAAEYWRVLNESTGNVEASFNLGNVYLEQREWSEAESLFRFVIQLVPADAHAWTNLGTALREQYRTSEAADAYREAIRLEPNHAAALTNLGAIYRDEGRFEEAIACHRQAIGARPDLAEAYVNLGNVEHQLDHHGEALRAYQQAIRLAPNRDDAWLSVGHLLRELGDTVQARQVYHALAQRRAGDPLNALRRIATCPSVFGSKDELDEYRADFLETARAFEGVELDLDLSRLAFTAPECPFNLQFLEGDLRPLKEAFARVYAPFLSRFSGPLPSRNSGKPLLGIVALTRWASSFLPPFGGVVERLAKQHFDVTIFCRREASSTIRQALNRDDITVVGLSDRLEEAIAGVRASRCDILYYWEIGTSPTNYFLPFVRLAPIQVTSWGIQVTSGIPTIDAYLSSDWVEPFAAEKHYSERLIRARSMLTYRQPVVLPKQLLWLRGEKIKFLARLNLYGCVQNLGKFHPDIDELLAGILREDPRGIILVAEDRSGFAARLLRQRFARSIPDVADRVVFTPNLKNAEYLNLINACDVLLDPPHFGGVSTTYDAVALGKPVVTYPSGFQRGAYTAGLFRYIGVTDTIALDPTDYIRLAVELAIDRDRNEHIAAKLRAAHSEVFEVESAVREHEQLFLELLTPCSQALPGNTRTRGSASEKL